MLGDEMSLAPRPEARFQANWQKGLAYQKGLYRPSSHSGAKSADDIRLAANEFADKVSQDDPQCACRMEFSCRGSLMEGQSQSQSVVSLGYGKTSSTTAPPGIPVRNVSSSPPSLDQQYPRQIPVDGGAEVFADVSVREGPPDSGKALRQMVGGLTALIFECAVVRAGRGVSKRGCCNSRVCRNETGPALGMALDRTQVLS